ncbi:hypothetical protein BH10ACI2_BH10ACI2_25860 [soil metagenome]
MTLKNISIILCVLCASVVNSLGQEMPPDPSAPKSINVPAVAEKKLSNGLTVAVVERKGVPLVTIQLLVKNGAAAEDESQAGLADLTASMLTKGTKTKSATEIAEAIEFLGGAINSGAGWNSSFVSVTVTSDKVEQAMAIMSDVVLNPKFDQKELDLLKSQSLDGLTYNLKQPSFLANYVASKYSFNEHPAGGTPASISQIQREDIAKFYAVNFVPVASVFIFSGDISPVRASQLTDKYFKSWKQTARESEKNGENMPTVGSNGVFQRMLVIDLPKSGQAAVVYAKKNYRVGRNSNSFYTASVLNSVLGGGYSSRLNYEIRIKRGLSYGAGSGFAWRGSESNFSTRIQTKTVSAAEVLDLVVAEIKKISDISVANDEIVPRKSVLTGNFGRNLETTGGLAGAVGDLYAFGIPTSELNAYASSVNEVTDTQIKDFAKQNLMGGDVIIVGDYSDFKDDLAKRFPNMKVDVIKAADLDLSKDNLRK